jgi:predicted peptidase
LALALNLTVTLIVAMLATVASGAWTPPVHSAAARAAQGRATPAATTSQAPAFAVPRVKPVSVPRGTFASYVYGDPSGAHMIYYLYAPADYTPSGRYPLVLILHGGGEVALAKADPLYNENLVLNQDYVRAFSNVAAQEQWPSFVLVPQAAAGNRWVNVPASVRSYTLASQPSVSLAMAMNILAATLRSFPAIDRDRVYVTGISMGAFGTWEAAERWPNIFAAAMPIAGSGDPKAAAALTQMAIWAFHGTADTTVPVAGSRRMISAIRADGGGACYTEYPGRGHDLWAVKSPLDQTETLAWLFSQSKDPPSNLTPLPCPATARD